MSANKYVKGVFVCVYVEEGERNPRVYLPTFWETLLWDYLVVGSPNGDTLSAPSLILEPPALGYPHLETP